MKIKYLLTLGCLLFSMTACRSQEVQLTIKVTDDFGKPVQGATVGIATYDKWKPGEGFGEDIWKNTKAKTDTNGMATLNGSSPRADIAYGVDSMPGYYSSEGGN